MIDWLCIVPFICLKFFIVPQTGESRSGCMARASLPVGPPSPVQSITTQKHFGALPAGSVSPGWTVAMITSRSHMRDNVLQTAFKDYIGALVLHKSSVSGMYLRDDPTILGWELTNSAVCPGDDTGDTVQACQLRQNRA